MYQKIVEELRKAEKLRMMITVPACLVFAVIALVFPAHDAFGMILRFGVPAFLLIVVAVEYKGYRDFDLDLAAMKAAVGAQTDLDMSRIMERSVNLENYYFIADECVLNFFTRRAYLRSGIRSVQRYEDHHSGADDAVTGTDYYIRVYLDGGAEDRMQFSSLKARDTALKLLQSEPISAQLRSILS